MSLLSIIKLFALRGLLLFKGFSGKRIELVILSALALALLPTMQLAFANPLMPPRSASITLSKSPFPPGSSEHYVPGSYRSY